MEWRSSAGVVNAEWLSRSAQALLDKEDGIGVESNTTRKTN
jgi:hypothetical protein